ncbi:MAG: L,D-transpeptidase family protein [Verrucomicrobia bacterium]|nr:L,D-transpeptidase family protein [Verrucomicrobiota bacterium]MBU1734655.1 L,D-transpeptidase family protein [Verrucomicrobiota bacterium]MBU1858151.1 L,D-transpeptidase family protein [Verrucomicrobiota bacterium]
MADNDLKNILIQENAGRPRLTPFLLIILLVVAGVAAVVLSRPWWEKHGNRAAQPLPLPVPKQMPHTPQQQSFQAICALASNKSLEEARQKGYALLAQTKDPALTASLETLLGQINIELILSQAPMPEKEEYVVKAGDSLERIARKFKTTVDLIKKSNALQRPVLHPGDRLRVFKGTFTMAISKRRNDLVLKANDRFFKRYRVGTGKFGTTPVGTFVIAEKIEQPPWWRPDGKMIPFGDKENVLGTRWMSLQATGATDAVRGYGLHGTWEPETIGRQASAGCVRLLNSEVEELFLLVPNGTSVVITEQ